MSAIDKVFAGSIPEIYDRYMVPLIFEPYAEDLVQRLAAVGPRDVLEIAAGTGIVTRTMSARLPRSVRIVATDLNQPMVDFASSRPTPGRSIEWKQADALSLPFQDGSFDAGVCQFGAMFFPDRVRAYKEVLRVLRRDGRFFFNVWDRISDNEFIETVSAALARIFPNDPPRFMERTPHGYHDPARIREDLAAAGFAKVSIEFVDRVSKAASARDAAIAYCQGNPLRTEIEARGPPGLEAATAQATAALENRYGKGPIEGRIRALVITAGREASRAES